MHDYNVIFNDMVLIKWKKNNHVFIFKNSLRKNDKKIIIMISILIHNHLNKLIN
jgi:hypothetical protein